LPSNDSGAGATPILIVPETVVTTVPSVNGSESTVLASVVPTLSSETTNLLTRLGKDGLSSALSANVMSIIESIGASVTATLTTDGAELMRTLTSDEERVIQELVQVAIYSLLTLLENTTRQR